MAATYPDVIPMIAYEDGPKAMDWLSSAFGFKERSRMVGEDGRLSHGEMQAGDGVDSLVTATPHIPEPRPHLVVNGTAGRRDSLAYIEVVHPVDAEPLAETYRPGVK